MKTLSNKTTRRLYALRGGKIQKKKLYLINPKYTLYSDGRCYSESTDRFLKPLANQPRNKKCVSNYCYGFSTENGYVRHQIFRLVMFYFGAHDFTNISDMPPVTSIDGNSKNFDVSNLAFNLDGFSQKKSATKYDRYKNSKLSEKHLPIIYEMRDNGCSLSAIANQFGVSDMSIHRALKRRNA